MALPSQTDRNGDSSRNVISSGGPGNNTAKVAMIVLGVGIAVLGIWGIAKFAPARNTSDPAKELASKSGAAPTTDKTAAPVTIQRNDITNPGALPGTTTSTTTGTTPGTTPNPTDAANQPATHTAPSGATPPGTTPLPGANGGTTTPGAQPTDPALPVTNLQPANAGVLGFIASGDSAMSANKFVEARKQYSKAILSPDSTNEQRSILRSKLATINEDLVFSARVDAADPLCETYKVQSGDALARIPRKRELAVDYRFIQRINRITNPQSLRVGQTLKLVRGPFHAVVNKADFRVDLYAGSPDEPAQWLYIRSFACGLGEDKSDTPVGNYVIKKNSKLVNPNWTNPRTGEKFAADDPKNPIGEFWLGWQGVGDSVTNTGIGFHGTIDPSSIGQKKSMGCVRLGAEDIAMLYEVLVEEVSVVRVLP